MADLWLAVPARVLRPGLVCFGFLGRVLPELAGFGEDEGELERTAYCTCARGV